VGRRRLGQEAGGHLIGEAAEVVMDLDLQLGEPGGVVSQSVPPQRLEGLGLLAEGTEEIVTGGDQGSGLGLEAHLHGQLSVAVMREGRSSLSVEGHDTRSRGKRTLFGNRPVVKGAARYVVGERLENSGMRWIEERAEAPLLLRCIEVNGDWEAFMRWSQERRNQELERGQVVQIRSKKPIQLPEAA
jgi:hypothetical protein